MKSKVKQQHYIPNKSYLDYFTDKSLTPQMLWVYFDRQEVVIDASSAKYKNITPLNLCKESYLYETPRLPVNAIEKALQKIEDGYKSVLDNKIIPKKRLTPSDKLRVSYFFSTLEVRTPLNKQNTDNFINEVREKVVHLEEAHMQGRKSKMHEELDESQEQNIAFAQLLMAAVEVNRFEHVDMLFLSPKFQDDRTFFITSDFPVTMVDFTSMNSFYPPTPMGATVEVLIPLTPNIAVFVNNLGLNGYKEIDHNFVWEVNSRILSLKTKYIISPKKLDKDFGYYNAKRFPQSFVLLSLEDQLWKRNHKKVDRILRKRIINMIKKTVVAYVQFCKKYIEETDLTINCISIFTGSDQEYVRLMDEISKSGRIVHETDINILCKLKKPITTKAGELSLLRIMKPNNTAISGGDAEFHTPNFDLFKEKYKNNEKFRVIGEGENEVIELLNDNNEAIVCLPRKPLTVGLTNL